jgi:hypothetical protein
MSPPASLARGVALGDLAALACIEGGGQAENAGKISRSQTDAP